MVPGDLIEVDAGKAPGFSGGVPAERVLTRINRNLLERRSVIGRDRRNGWRLSNLRGRACDQITILPYLSQDESVGGQRFAGTLERACGMQGSSDRHCWRNQIG